MFYSGFKGLIVFSILLPLYKDICCTTIVKDININGLQHRIMGTSSLVNGVSIEIFGNIPYAMPPVGVLRFKHPREIEGRSWTGVYNSTAQPNTCWQAEGGEFDKLNPAARLWLSKTAMSEDCLYLTIWASAASAEKLPVMVWIYGGSFLSGSSTLEVYDGSTLAARHNVIVVSLQYRLGPLGFLYIDEVSAPGNQGLMDQRLALKWVKNNIANFNGDDNRITIFGESAGSASVSFHVLSPLSQNFFNRAIMESGTALSPWAIETKEESILKAKELAKYVNCGSVDNNMTKLSHCLNSVDPLTLSNLQFNLKELATKQRLKLFRARGITELITDGSYFIEFYFKPIYDNFFIPKNVTTLLSLQSSRKNIDLLMGFNANEGMYFLLYGLNNWLKLLDKGDVLMTSNLSPNNSNHIKASKLILENLSNEMFSYKSLMSLLMYEYDVPSQSMGDVQWDDMQVMSAFDRMTGDELFVCPVITFAETMVENKQNVYLYNFLHRTERVTLPKWVGTLHGYEIEYVFGMPFVEEFKKLYYTFNESEERLSDVTMKLWTNFAKFGNPTPNPIDYFNQSVSWLPYNTKDPRMFHFAISDAVPYRKNKKSKQCRFWSKVIPDLISELSKGSKSTA